MSAAAGGSASERLGIVRVSPGRPPARWQVRVPGSKSLTNRALLLAGLARGDSTLCAPLIADDTEAMAGAIRALGAGAEPGVVGEPAVAGEPDGGGDWHVRGIDGAPRGPGRIWCGMAGTVARFILPAVAAGDGRFEIDAHPQLRRRPLGPLLDALREQGTALDGDTLPLTLHASGLAGGDVAIDATVSSQFLSGLLMAAPLARAPMRLRFADVVSRPYVTLTIEAMRAFGVDVQAQAGSLSVSPSSYRATRYQVEPDASTASYFLAAAALTGTVVSLPGLTAGSVQGDIELVSILERMGCRVGQGAEALKLGGPQQLAGISVGMGDSSDVFMTLACVAPFADSPTTIEGIGHARVKESDRIGATAENLRRLGIAVEEGRDHLIVHPGTPRPARLPTHEDHRIAMAFAAIGTRVPVELEDPDVVAKTCPRFWDLWRETGAQVDRRPAAVQRREAGVERPTRR